MIIDCHTHVGEFGGGTTKGSATLDDLIKSMDEAGIEMSLVISTFLTEFKEGVKRRDLVEEIRSYKNRLRPIIHIDFSRIEEAGYLEALVEDLKDDLVVGIKFYPGYQDSDPLDIRVEKIFEVAREVQKPVMIHTGYLMEGVESFSGDVHPKLLGEVAKKFPENKIIGAHFGNPWIKECGEMMKAHKNLYADLSGYFAEFKSINEEEIQEFKEDSDIFMSSGAEISRILFGTDWPLYSQKQYVEAVKSLPLSSEEFEKIFYKNSREVFGVDLNAQK